MEKTGSDFTNTFRILGKIKKNGKNEDVVMRLMQQSAPKDFFLKNYKH